MITITTPSAKLESAECEGAHDGGGEQQQIVGIGLGSQPACDDAQELGAGRGG